MIAASPHNCSLGWNTKMNFCISPSLSILSIIAAKPHNCSLGWNTKISLLYFSLALNYSNFNIILPFQNSQRILSKILENLPKENL